LVIKDGGVAVQAVNSAAVRAGTPATNSLINSSGVIAKSQLRRLVLSI
jgi:hypothetical protein